MTHTIAILPMDIDTGRQFSSSSCPIALAAKREFPDKKVSVGCNILVIGEKVIELPPVAVRFVTEFDRNKSVKPFSFGVNL